MISHFHLTSWVGVSGCIQWDEEASLLPPALPALNTTPPRPHPWSDGKEHLSAVQAELSWSHMITPSLEAGWAACEWAKPSYQDQRLWATQWSALSTQPHQPSLTRPRAESRWPGGAIGQQPSCSQPTASLQPCCTSGPGSWIKCRLPWPHKPGPPLPLPPPLHLHSPSLLHFSLWHLPVPSRTWLLLHWEHLPPKCLLCSLLLSVCRSPLWGLTQPSIFYHTFKCYWKLIA